jgi:hypothetical protein
MLSQGTLMAMGTLFLVFTSMTMAPAKACSALFQVL